jgi:hypothetical protein
MAITLKQSKDAREKGAIPLSFRIREVIVPAARLLLAKTRRARRARLPRERHLRERLTSVARGQPRLRREPPRRERQQWGLW